MKSIIGIGALAMLLAGCATSPVERQENVNDELAQVKNEMVETREQIGQTLSSLNTLIKAPADDIPSAYERYAQNVDALKKSSEGIEKNAAQLHERREQWLAGKMERTGGTITQLDGNLKERAKWTFYRGWPSKWEVSEFDASKSELAIETMEIQIEGLKWAAGSGQKVSTSG